MKITWYGHSCFSVETEAGSVVLDPYAPGSVPGCAMPKVRADAVICSHGHMDHGYAEGAELTGNVCGIDTRSVKSFHDDAGGALRGSNDITVLCADGITLVHLGDLGHTLSSEQLEEIGKTDVLLIPVGGYYTIDADTAYEVCRSLSPTVIIPMHYRTESRGYDVLQEVTPFLQHFEPEEITYSDTAYAELALPLKKQVLVFRKPVV